MLRVLTWNILADEFIEKEDYLYFDFNLLKNRQKRIETITSHIIHQNCDIILLQEVMLLELAYLQELLSTDFYFSDLFPIQWDSYNHSESGNIVLFHKKYFINSFQNVPLIYKNAIFGCQVTLTLSFNNQPLHVFNIHLNDEYFLIRKDQLESIHHLLYEHNYVILGGDFNQNYWANQSLYNLNNFLLLNDKQITYYVDNENLNIDQILTKGFHFIQQLPNYILHNKIDNTNDANDANDATDATDATDANNYFINLYGSDHFPVGVEICYL